MGSRGVGFAKGSSASGITVRIGLKQNKHVMNTRGSIYDKEIIYLLL